MSAEDLYQLLVLQENNLQWDKSDALINLDDDEDERRSISSESSGEGLGVESPRFHKQYRLHDQEIWQNRGIDKTLKELPNFEQILDIVNKGELPGKCDLLKEQNKWTTHLRIF